MGMDEGHRELCLILLLLLLFALGTSFPRALEINEK
jgi:hypothetical protein